MTKKLNWTTSDVANTDSHSYRISEIGHTIQVIYSKLPDGVAMQSCYLESKQEAKQWAQNYHNKYGASHE